MRAVKLITSSKPGKKKGDIFRAPAEPIEGRPIIRAPGRELKGRIVYGIASTPKVCVSGKGGMPSSLDPLGVNVQLPVPLLSAHRRDGQIGEVVELEQREASIWIKAVVWETRAANHVWEKIRQSELTGFSVLSGRERECTADGVVFVDRWRLLEVSVCRTPANDDCRIKMYWVQP